MKTDLRGRRRRKLSMEERVRHYATRISLHPETGCWLWNGKIRRDGYAVVYIEYKDRLLHQVMYEFFHGDRPAGTNLHHICEPKHCVNPQHLELHSVAGHVRLHPEGMLKAVHRSAELRRAQTHCLRGHEFNDQNTYWTSQGWRRCRACDNLRRSEKTKK